MTKNRGGNNGSKKMNRKNTAATGRPNSFKNIFVKAIFCSSECCTEVWNFDVQVAVNRD
jgi:hypothetical protein